MKSEKHSSSKVKTLKEIAAVDIEKLNSIKELVDQAVTENRLNQGIDKLGEMSLEIDIKNTGAYIKWVVGDVIKEEKDTIIASGFDVKEIMPHVSEKAKKFWMNYLNTH
jgi:ferritin